MIGGFKYFCAFIRSSPICPSLARETPWNFDFRNFSSPGLLKSRTIRATASWKQDSSSVAILLWLVLLLNLAQQMISTHHAWNFPWFKMLASWFWCPYIWFGFRGSRSTRSNHQSSATLWVLETCLIVGLHPFWRSLWSLLHCLRTHTTKLLDARIGHWRERNQYSLSHWPSLAIFDVFLTSLTGPPCSIWHPTIPEQANHPISIQCPKRWFQILLNCEKQQFVSCTSNLWEQMYGFRKCIQDLPRSQSLETVPSLHCLAVLPTWQYCLYSHVWWMCEINRFRRLSQALVHFVIDRANLFTDHRISSLPIRA